MALPKIQAPTFALFLPVCKKNVKYRPFTVKEEKLLLMAAESNSPADINIALEQVINNCLVDAAGIAPSELHIFDLELLFIAIRAASVSNEAQIFYRPVGSPDAQPVQLVVDLNEVVQENIKNVTVPSKQIAITETVGVVMKDVTLGLFADLGEYGEKEITMHQVFEIVKKMIHSVYDEESVYLLSDCTDEEINDFLDSFQSTDRDKLYQFMNDIPRVRHKFTYSVDGKNQEGVLEGIADFFQ